MDNKLCKSKTTRISSVELLRIISMLLVLIIHANQWTEKMPLLDLRENTISSSVTILLQTLSCVCVNVFVLISGWFGIRFSYIGMLKFVFQCLFFLCGIYAVMVCLHLRDFNVEGIMGCFFLLKWNWFIKVYLLLYIVSPILNRFLDNTSKKELERILLLFFAFQTLYGFLTDAAQFFVWGLSLTSFVGLYLLAQYIKRYHYRKPDSIFDKYCNLGGYMFLFFITFIVAMISSYYKFNYLLGKIFAYTSPLVIMMSITLLVTFLKSNKLSFYSSFINNVAISCFAAFLLHSNSFIIKEYYGKYMMDLYLENTTLLYLCKMTVSIFAIFIVSILIDKVRIYIWNIVEHKLYRTFFYD